MYCWIVPLVLLRMLGCWLTRGNSVIDYWHMRGFSWLHTGITDIRCVAFRSKQCRSLKLTIGLRFQDMVVNITHTTARGRLYTHKYTCYYRLLRFSGFIDTSMFTSMLMCIKMVFGVHIRFIIVKFVHIYVCGIIHCNSTNAITQPKMTHSSGPANGSYRCQRNANRHFDYPAIYQTAIVSTRCITETEQSSICIKTEHLDHPSEANKYCRQP